MSTRREEGTVVFDCDGCSEDFDTEEQDFQDGVDALKAAGWEITKDARGEWAHYCPPCREERRI